MQIKVLKALGIGLTAGLTITVISLFSRTAKTSGPPEVNVAVAKDHDANTAGFSKSVLSEQLGAAIRGNGFPAHFDFKIDGRTQATKVQYTLDATSQAAMQKLMNQYQPDYGAFIAMDAKTGKILSMVSYSHVAPDQENLTLRASFPAASVFKVVTASAAIDMNKAVPSTVVPFNGALHTLYKRNVESTLDNRWTRHMTMREAFARSVNVFFSKLGLFYVGPQNLQMYAERYFFNHQIKADVPVQMGYAKFSPDDPWSVATAASGYTRDNTMSPLQGALIAAAVANDGVMMEPYLIENLSDDAGAMLYQGGPHQASVVVEPASAETLRELFHETVIAGTSRKSFRQTNHRSLYGDVEFGGKTGSLMGLDPKGKCDWFVGYARYHDQRIAVAALTVNEKKWKIKASMISNIFFQQYLKDLKRNEQVAAIK
jgi:cell division protein FtsI/penicillin-binding protein 2